MEPVSLSWRREAFRPLISPDGAHPARFTMDRPAGGAWGFKIGPPALPPAKHRRCLIGDAQGLAHGDGARRRGGHLPPARLISPLYTAIPRTTPAYVVRGGLGRLGEVWSLTGIQGSSAALEIGAVREGGGGAGARAIRNAEAIRAYFLIKKAGKERTWIPP